MERILVTGGAGFIGSVLVPMLLQRGYRVRVLDNLRYGGDVLLPNFVYKDFEFMRGDVVDEEAVRAALQDIDVIIHLAAIVGYPACRKNPQLAEAVNVTGTQNIDRHRHRDQLILFASTYSNYGDVMVKEEHCTEETPLNPMTTYGKTKTEAERYLLEAGNVICYRFATGFGLSPRLRLDLLVNDFVFSALKQRTLIVYEKNFKRTFIHVRDMARAFLFALDHRQAMVDQVYNAGSDHMNYSKEEVALLIRQKLEFFLHFAEVGEDLDKRNYFVSYEKLHALGFDTTVSLEEGIDELIRGLEVIEIHNRYTNV